MYVTETTMINVLVLHNNRLCMVPFETFRAQAYITGRVYIPCLDFPLLGTKTVDTVAALLEALSRSMTSLCCDNRKYTQCIFA